MFHLGSFYDPASTMQLFLLKSYGRMGKLK